MHIHLGWKYQKNLCWVDLIDQIDRESIQSRIQRPLVDDDLHQIDQRVREYREICEFRNEQTEWRNAVQNIENQRENRVYWKDS